jgi:hypothetical protein
MSTTLALNDEVQVLFGATWKDGKVTAVNGDGTYDVLSAGCPLKAKPAAEVLPRSAPTPVKTEEQLQRIANAQRKRDAADACTKCGGPRGDLGQCKSGCDGI